MTVHAERRRRWSAEEKLRIVRETLRPGAVARAVADRHGIGTGLLYMWRKQMLTAAMTGFASVEMAAEPETPPLLATPGAAADEMPRGTEMAAATLDVAVEVELPNGARVRVGNGASATLLSGVFAALDQR